ncbi:MAG: CBS domain-containing protein [Gaiellaceae bacterium]
MGIVDVMNLHVVEVDPEADLRTAAQTMIENGVGSVAVCEDARLVGILTERDILRLVANGRSAAGTKVADTMTTELVTAGADADILDVAQVMGQNHIRHLPVVEGDNLLGMVGVREIVDALAERLWRTQETDVRASVHTLLGTLRQRSAQRG